jgi:hypothetical protein
MTDVFYFGCIRVAGHYLFDPRTQRSVYDVPHPWQGEPHIDGGLAPAKRAERYNIVEAPQGQAALHYKRGWTALAFWDRTVDSRGACSSTFLAKGFFDYDELVDLAKAQWPALWERFERGGDPPAPPRPGLRQSAREPTPFTVKHVETVSDGWGIAESARRGANGVKLLEHDWSPDDLRDKGWMVAVHNDYHQNGEWFTFWLVTKDGEALKGEGSTDAVALNQIRLQLELPCTPLYAHQILEFAKALQHGDEKHREWLLDAARAFMLGEPLPLPQPLENIDDGLTDG